MTASLKDKRTLYRELFFSVFLSVAVTALGFIFGYPTTLTPTSHYRTFSGIARDGWIEDGASIRLPRLLPRGNRLNLELKGWRPPGVPPAEIEFLLCGKAIHHVVVHEPTTVELYLTGSCEPREISFRVVNPFQPSASDSRQLGTQLLSVTTHSRIGVPLVHYNVVFQAVPFVLIPLLLLYLLTRSLGVARGFQRVVLFLAAAGGGALIASTHISPVGRLFTLFTVVTLTLVGALIGVRWHEVRRESLPDCNKGEELCWGSCLFLLFILGIGAYLRFADLSFGLPANYHPDEVPKVNAIMRMYNSGNLNPQYFLHPTLLLYLTYGMNVLFGFIGMHQSGEFQQTLVLAGRTVSATAGLLSLLLVYGIGRRLFSRGVGLFAAALLAVFPLHVACSRYLKEDATLTFFILLSFYSIVLAYRSKNGSWLILSGLFAGCSASVKYSGMLSAGIPCLGALVLEERWIPRRLRTYLLLAAALALVPVAMLACSPYIILDSAQFIKDFSHEQNHMQQGHYFAITPWSQYWTYHIERSLSPGITIVPYILTFLALGFFFAPRAGTVPFREFFGRWSGKLPALMICSLILAFYLPAEYVKAKPAPQPERYILPCIPFIALLIAAFIQSLSESKRKYLLLSTLIVLLPALRSFQLHSEIVPDTRLLMQQWIEANVEPGVRIYVDHKRYSTELSEERYQLTYAPRAMIHRDLDLKELKRQGYDYLLLSSLWYDRYFSQPRTEEAVRNKIAKVLEEGKVAARFAPKYGTYGFHNPVVTLFELRE